MFNYYKNGGKCESAVESRGAWQTHVQYLKEFLLDEYYEDAQFWEVLEEKARKIPLVPCSFAWQWDVWGQDWGNLRIRQMEITLFQFTNSQCHDHLLWTKSAGQGQ